MGFIDIKIELSYIYLNNLTIKYINKYEKYLLLIKDERN